MSFIQIAPCQAQSCLFEKTPVTLLTLNFELFVGIASLFILGYLSRKTPRFWPKVGALALGVITFEMFTMPMWNNFHMGSWAYLYRDVSWILGLGWVTVMMSVITMVDHKLVKTAAWVRFFGYLIFLTVLIVPIESIIGILGIRSYSPEVMATISGYYLGNLPVEVFYYVPVFSALVIGFYKYWEFTIDHQALVPVRRNYFFRNLVLSIIAVFLYELMIEPMVTNVNFPSWSYVYRDITVFMTGFWVLLIWISLWLVDRYGIHWDQFQKFIGYLVIAGIIALPTEVWFIHQGFRIYGESSVANFSGYTVPVFNAPVEVAFAIPFYLALVIGLTKYWQIILDNRKI